MNKCHVLLLQTSNDAVFKRIKRKLVKTFSKNNVSVLSSNTTLKQHISHLLKIKTHKDLYVLHDRQVLSFDFPYIFKSIDSLQFPNDWDVLSFGGEIKEYDYKHPSNTPFFVKATINTPFNYIINNKSLLKFNQLSTDQLHTFVLTQYNLTQPLHKQNVFEKVSECALASVPGTDVPVSFITVVSEDTKEDGVKSILAYCSREQKKDCELIVVDTCNFHKTVKQSVSEDASIKFVQIESKNNAPIPTGYCLNAAVKNASNDIIFHLLPQNFYISSNFSLLLNTFVNSHCDMMFSADSSYLHKETQMSFCSGRPSLCNVLYKKSFWNVFKFDELENDHVKLLYHFTCNRAPLIKTFPSFLCSFLVTESQTVEDTSQLPFSLSDFLCGTSKKLLFDKLTFSSKVHFQ